MKNYRKESIDRAITLLSFLMADGSKPYGEVKGFCRVRGVTTGMLREARRRTGVKTIRREGTWYWEYPVKE